MHLTKFGIDFKVSDEPFDGSIVGTMIIADAIYILPNRSDVNVTPEVMDLSRTADYRLYRPNSQSNNLTLIDIKNEFKTFFNIISLIDDYSINKVDFRMASREIGRIIKILVATANSSYMYRYLKAVGYTIKYKNTHSISEGQINTPAFGTYHYSSDFDIIIYFLPNCIYADNDNLYIYNQYIHNDPEVGSALQENGGAFGFGEDTLSSYILITNNSAYVSDISDEIIKTFFLYKSTIMHTKGYSYIPIYMKNYVTDMYVKFDINTDSISFNKIAMSTGYLDNLYSNRESVNSSLSAEKFDAVEFLSEKYSDETELLETIDRISTEIFGDTFLPMQIRTDFDTANPRHGFYIIHLTKDAGKIIVDLFDTCRAFMSGDLDIYPYKSISVKGMEVYGMYTSGLSVEGMLGYINKRRFETVKTRLRNAKLIGFPGSYLYANDTYVFVLEPRYIINEYSYSNAWNQAILDYKLQINS